MKKVIFISALAIAAAVSCTKSDIVDTKFNEQISFETYTGRDAQTKAAVTNIGNLGSVYVYGYYTGAEKWDGSMTANLWNPMTLTVATDGKGSVPQGQERYWTNDDDLYTFLAYAPLAETIVEGTTPTNPLTVAVTEDGPTLTYKVPAIITDQKDLLYAIPQVDRTKGEGVVDLQMKHALSRITVKAKDNNINDDFTFDVKEVTLSGKFNVTGNLPLSTGEWKNPAPSTENNGISTFEIFANDKVVEGDKTTYGTYNSTNALTEAYKDYAYYAETTKSEVANNYVMVIPTTEDVTLTVAYTIYYSNKESKVITKTFDVATDFAEGKAYTINLDFDNNATQITFNVTVDSWDDVADDNADGDLNDDSEFTDPDEETTIEGGNPEKSTDWTE